MFRLKEHASMKPDKREIDYVQVRSSATIGGYAIEKDGTWYPTWLGAGRHDCEGYLLRGGSRYLRLRSADGDLQVVAEQALNMWRSSRRVYRKPASTATQATTSPSDWHPVWRTNIRTITPEKRLEVRRQIQAAAPKPLPGRYLGTYEEMGSLDIWKVSYSIELHGDSATAYFNRPGGQEQIGPYGAERLADAVSNSGVSPERFIADLRKTGDDSLAAFADEVEDVLGRCHSPQGVDVAQGVEMGLGEVNAEEQQSPQDPSNHEVPPIPANDNVAKIKAELDDKCLFFCGSPVKVEVVWHSFERSWFVRFDGYNDYTCYELSGLPLDATDAEIAGALEVDLGVRNPSVEILRPKQS
jgi:hypothetical protein